MTLRDTGGNEETYAGILDQAWDDVPEDVVLPAGPYRLRCTGAGTKDATDEKPARAWFVYSIVEPGADVDLAAYNRMSKADRDALELMVSFNIKRKYDITRLNNHILAHGVKPQAGQTRKDIVSACKSAEVMAFVEPDEYQDKTSGEQIVTNRAKEFHVAK
jgi:hypothetical protein